MPAGRIPGVANQATRPVRVKDGTLPARPTPSPGPTRQASATADARGSIDPRREQALVLARFLLELIGIAEPATAADSADALMSVWRGDWMKSVAGGTGVLLCLGDAAKAAKLSGCLRSIRAAVQLAATDSRFARELAGALKRIRGMLDTAPLEKLPERSRNQVQAIRKEIDEYLGARWVKSLGFGQICPFRDLLNSYAARSSSRSAAS